MYPENCLHLNDVIELFNDCRSVNDVRYVFISALRESIVYAWPLYWRERLKAECVLRLERIKESSRGR